MTNFAGTDNELPQVSVLMPTFKQAQFIQRALDSLIAQTLTNWELIIIDDASPDLTYSLLSPYLTDRRIIYHRFDQNKGFGVALNYGLSHAHSNIIAYLPSDDVYYSEHLASLVNLLAMQPDCVATYSGVRHHYNRMSTGQIEGYPLQMVQIVHRLTSDLWLERKELITDDLAKMYWEKLAGRGKFESTGQITCEWVSHPEQHHKIVQEPEGGINLYRQYYQVEHPMRFHSTVGNYIDEVQHYQHYRERSDTPLASDALKILMVGELAYNADRVLALEERGHKLYGLWMPKPYWYNTVGPLPFGHVEEVSSSNWRDEIRRIKPDLIYGLLNWQAVPFVHEVMKEATHIPFVWHFKEGPFICLEKGSWPELVELYRKADGQIYSSPEMRDWFFTVVPGLATSRSNLVLDGDLPKRDWLTNKVSPRLSALDGEIHTVVPGRPIGMHPSNVKELAEQGIHLHFYGDFTHGQWREWITKAKGLAPRHLHLHSQVDQENWVQEFSQYDAGWLHFFKSQNQGEIRRANWDDLNYPARLATLGIAGLPVLQGDNRNAIVATQSFVEKLDAGLFFSELGQLGLLLRDKQRMSQLRENMWRQREIFTFDYHADRLLEFFRKVIAEKPKNK